MNRQPALFDNGINALHSYRIVVLLVDDQPMIAEAVKRCLEDERDIEFHYCNDPTKAIKIANRIKPTIILQDLVMPEIEGLMMVRFFRVNKETAQVPIIVLSTKEDPKIKSEAFSLGVNDYLVKLPDKIELIARIRYHSKAYNNQRQRDEAFLALQESQKKLNEANRALEKLSSLDGLTGIANRRVFDKTIKQEWQRAMRHGTPISLIMLDIDFFKKYNDTYGHQGGDICLKKVAEVIQKAEKRSTDLAARYGGEEFAIVLPETSNKGVRDIAQSILTGIREYKIPHESSKAADIVTVSIGTSTSVPERNSKSGSLIQAADKALYKAKEEGRNTICHAPYPLEGHEQSPS